MSTMNTLDTMVVMVIMNDVMNGLIIIESYYHKNILSFAIMVCVQWELLKLWLLWGQ